MKRVPRVLQLSVATALLGLFGVVGGAAASPAAGTSTVATPTLKVVLPTTGADILIHLALAKGYFARRGVNVTITENAGANAVPILASKQADIMLNTTAAIPLLTLQGRETVAIYGAAGGGQGGSLAVSTANGIDSIADLQARKGRCRLGSGPAPQAVYGYANYYNEKYKLDCDVVPIGDVASQLAALASNSIQALVIGRPNIVSAITDNRVKLLVDPRFAKQRVGNFVEVSIMALRETIQTRRPDIVRFLRAINDAAVYFKASTNMKVAGDLRGFDIWSTLSQQEIAQNVVGGLRPHIMVGQELNGWIGKGKWDLMLRWMTYWGLAGYNQSDARIQFNRVVDMGPYISAIGKPKPKPKR